MFNLYKTNYSKEEEKQNLISHIISNNLEWNKYNMKGITEQYNYLHFQLGNNTSKIITNKNELNTHDMSFSKNDSDCIQLKPNMDNYYFSIFYIIKYGIEQYNFFTNKNMLFRNEKMNMISNINNDIKNHKKRVKDNKLKINVTNILNDLATTKFIELNTLFDLFILYNIPVCFLIKQYFVTNFDSLNYHTIDITNAKIYNHKMCKSKIEQYFIKGHTLYKPLSSISSYKLFQLQEFAEKLSIDIFNANKKKKTKTLLYDEINSYLKV